MDRLLVCALVMVAALPTVLLNNLTPWNQSPEWARSVFQLGSLVLVLVFGLIPLIKWYEERLQDIVEKKPIVVTIVEGSAYSVRNIGDSPALNVWILHEQTAELIPLGALDAHESRSLPQSVVEALQSSQRHITLAFSRFPARPSTPAFNIWNASWGCYTHGFRRLFADGSVIRGGAVVEYLNRERTILLNDLNTFTGRCA